MSTIVGTTNPLAAIPGDPVHDNRRDDVYDAVASSLYSSGVGSISSRDITERLDGMLKRLHSIIMKSEPSSYRQELIDIYNDTARWRAEYPSTPTRVLSDTKETIHHSVGLEKPLGSLNNEYHIVVRWNDLPGSTCEDLGGYVVVDIRTWQVVEQPEWKILTGDKDVSLDEYQRLFLTRSLRDKLFGPLGSP